MGDEIKGHMRTAISTMHRYGESTFFFDTGNYSHENIFLKVLLAACKQSKNQDENSTSFVNLISWFFSTYNKNKYFSNEELRKLSAQLIITVQNNFYNKIPENLDDFSKMSMICDWEYVCFVIIEHVYKFYFKTLGLDNSLHDTIMLFDSMQRTLFVETLKKYKQILFKEVDDRPYYIPYNSYPDKLAAHQIDALENFHVLSPEELRITSVDVNTESLYGWLLGAVTNIPTQEYDRIPYIENVKNTLGQYFSDFTKRIEIGKESLFQQRVYASLWIRYTVMMTKRMQFFLIFKNVSECNPELYNIINNPQVSCHLKLEYQSEVCDSILNWLNESEKIFFEEIERRQPTDIWYDKLKSMQINYPKLYKRCRELFTTISADEFKYSIEHADLLPLIENAKPNCKVKTYYFACVMGKYINVEWLNKAGKSIFTNTDNGKRALSRAANYNKTSKNNDYLDIEDAIIESIKTKG